MLVVSLASAAGQSVTALVLEVSDVFFCHSIKCPQMFTYTFRSGEVKVSAGTSLHSSGRRVKNCLLARIIC